MSARTLRHIAQQAAIIGMEASCLAALAAFFGALDTLPIAPFVLVGWALLLFLRSLFGWAIWESAQGKLLLFAAGLLAISLLMGITSDEIALMAGPATFLRALTELPQLISGRSPLTTVMVAGLVLLYRVVVLVVQEVGVMGVARRVVWGLALLITVVFLIDIQRGYVAWDVLLTFGLCALLAFILSRTRELDSIPGVYAVPFSARWIITLLGIIAATLVGGAILQALSLEPLTRVGRLLQPLWSGLLIVLAFPLRLLLILLDPFLQVLAGMIDPQALAPLPDPEFNAGPQATQAQFSGWSFEWIQILAGIGVIVVILVIFTQAYRRLRRSIGATFVPKAEYGQAGRAQWFPFHFRNPFNRRAEYGVDTVRDLYRNVLIFGETGGVARAADDTPYEYLLPLSEKYPAVRAEFQALTDAYVATHYGEIQFSRGDIQRLQAAWQKIRSQHSGLKAPNSPS